MAHQPQSGAQHQQPNLIAINNDSANRYADDVESDVDSSYRGDPETKGDGGSSSPEKTSSVDLEKQQSSGKGKSQQDDGEEEEEEKDPNLIDWDGPDDPENPSNFHGRFKAWKKWIYSCIMGAMTLAVTFASSVFSTANQVTAKEYGVSEEVMILATSLFVLGFAIGPIVWGPFSELYGRKVPLLVGYAIFAIFNIPVAVAQNLQTIFVCRFFGGFFASAPLAIVGGYLADIWGPIERGYAMCIFSGSTFLGPTLGPVMGSFITESYLGWRWTQWITLIMAALFGSIGLIVLPETYAPILLHKRANKIRHETKNWAIHAKWDETPLSFESIATRYLYRPFEMLIKEPILLLMTIYMSFIYGLLYLLFESFPIAFMEVRGWSPGVASLPFLAIIVGVILGALGIVAITATRLKRKFDETGHVIPEDRLIPMMIGGVLLPIGFFWFSWTSHPGTNYWAQIIACPFLGAGIMMIFIQGFNYIIDCYMMNANSALAANTFARSWVGAGFPMFAVPMFHNLGVDWAGSLLGFLSIAMLPVPILFFIYGEKIRKLSKFSPTL